MAISVKGSYTSSGFTNTTTITFSHGLTIAANDVLVLVLSTVSTAADDNGEYALTKDYATPGTEYGCGHHIFTRVCGSSEPSTYSFTVERWHGYRVHLLQLSGVDTDNIWDVAPSASTLSGGYGTTATASSQTITTAGALGLFYVCDGVEAISNPTNSYGDGCGGTEDRSAYVYRRIFASTGATGDASATLANDTTWRAHQLAVRPFIPTFTGIRITRHITAA